MCNSITGYRFIKKAVKASLPKGKAIKEALKGQKLTTSIRTILKNLDCPPSIEHNPKVTPCNEGQLVIIYIPERFFK